MIHWRYVEVGVKNACAWQNNEFPAKRCMHSHRSSGHQTICLNLTITVEPRYNEVLGTMKITLLYQVSHYIRVKKQRNIKSWDQQNYLVIRGFCYIRPLYNEVPLYNYTLWPCRGFRYLGSIYLFMMYINDDTL